MVGNIKKFSFALTLLLVTGTCTSCTAFNDERQLSEADAAINAKQYPEAEKILRPLADSGNARATATLGHLYETGHGVPRDYRKARALYEKSAAAGDAEGLVCLAFALGKGLAGKKDIPKALELLEKSASLGYAEAEYKSGLLHLNGCEAIPKDYKRAFRLFRSSAQKGDGDAELLLGYMYEKGLGVTKDLRKAEVHRIAANAKTCSRGKCEIAGFYNSGILGAPKDYNKALELLHSSAKDGYAGAMQVLAGIYADGNGVKADAKESEAWYMKADENGSSTALYELADRLERGNGLPVDLKKAATLYAMAAKRGDMDSAASLGNCYAFGNGVKRDYTKAREWLEIAAAADRWEAIDTLAWIVEDGAGGKTKDPKRGI